MKVSQSFVVASLSVAAQTQVSRAVPLPNESSEVEVVASPIRNRVVSSKARVSSIEPIGFNRRSSVSSRAISLNIGSTGRANARVESQSNTIVNGGGTLIKAHLGSHRSPDSLDTINAEHSTHAAHLEAAGGAFPIQPSYSLDGQTLPNEPNRVVSSNGLHIGLSIRSDQNSQDQVDDITSTQNDLFNPLINLRLSDPRQAEINQNNNLDSQHSIRVSNEINPLETENTVATSDQNLDDSGLHITLLANPNQEGEKELPQLKKQRTIFDSHQERFKSFSQRDLFTHSDTDKFNSFKSFSKIKKWLRNPIPSSYQN